MAAGLLVTASVALLTGLVGLAYGLRPRRRRPRTTQEDIHSPHATARRQEPRGRPAGGAASDVSDTSGLPAGFACLSARLVP
jgi:hypothetical protein